MGLGISPRDADDSNEYSFSTMSTISAATTVNEEDSRKLQILEATVEGRPRSKLTREQRIKLGRQRFAESRMSSSNVSQDVFMSELELVLSSRRA